MVTSNDVLRLVRQAVTFCSLSVPSGTEQGGIMMREGVGDESPKHRRSQHGGQQSCGPCPVAAPGVTLLDNPPGRRRSAAVADCGTCSFTGSRVGEEKFPFVTSAAATQSK